jgi:hypothetical protein
VKKKLFVFGAVVAVATFVVAPVHAQSQILNVALGNRSTYSMSGIASNNATQSGTPGTAAPLAYSGSTWNQFGTNSPSGSGLLDSLGVATTVGFSVTGYKDAPGDHGGAGILQLLGAGVHADGPSTSGGWNPDPNTLPTLTLTGLNDSWTYSLAIVSGGNYNNTNQWNIGGTATFANPTTPSGFVGGTSLTTASNTGQRDTWVNGVNYVLFTNLTSVGGSLTVQDLSLNDKFSMNGFQLEVTSSTGVPEPGEWAAMGILGAGLTGLVLRKRRKA